METVHAGRLQLCMLGGEDIDQVQQSVNAHLRGCPDANVIKVETLIGINGEVLVCIWYTLP